MSQASVLKVESPGVVRIELGGAVTITTADDNVLEIRDGRIVSILRALQPVSDPKAPIIGQPVYGENGIFEGFYGGVWNPTENGQSLGEFDLYVKILNDPTGNRLLATPGDTIRYIHNLPNGAGFGNHWDVDRALRAKDYVELAKEWLPTEEILFEHIYQNRLIGRFSG